MIFMWTCSIINFGFKFWVKNEQNKTQTLLTPNDENETKWSEVPV